jgi:hypothetical protein
MLIIRRFMGDSENSVGVIKGVGMSEYGKISTASFGLGNGMRHGREGIVRTSHEARPDPNRGVVRFDFPINYP